MRQYREICYSESWKANGQLTESTNRLVHQGTVYECNTIPDTWADCYGTLATPAAITPDTAIEKEYQSIKDSIVCDQLAFSTVEVAAAISTLKRNKAAGTDNIDPEYILYGGTLLTEHLTCLFNSMLVLSYTPESFRVGLVIPTPKGRNKDLTNPSNYRGITILSNLSKVFEKLLVELQSQDSPPALNALQGGFRQGYSCSHTAFVYQEAIQSVRDIGNKVYVGFP